MIRPGHSYAVCHEGEQYNADGKRNIAASPEEMVHC